jgi:RNA-splicing ligase RtcB
MTAPLSNAAKAGFFESRAGLFDVDVAATFCRTNVLLGERRDMVELRGKHNTAKVYTDNFDQEAVSQIISLLNQEFAIGSRIRVMPDMHAGAGCVVGMTMTIANRVVPNMVGSDIGCGIMAVELKEDWVEPQRLDKAVRRLIPAGFALRGSLHPFAGEVDIGKLRCAKRVNLERAELSVGTLGGGNHFIEMDKDDEGRLYLVIHTGSRSLGKQVAEHYQNAAAKDLQRKAKEAATLADRLKKAGKEDELEFELKVLGIRKADHGMAFVEGALFDDYLHDIGIAQRFADLNRRAIAREIMREMKLKEADQFTTVHNYIDIDGMVLRKGAISAKSGERVLIPMNMRDGSIVCLGKGNPEWNFSAPHGAGRLMSRSEAKQSFTLTEYEKAMKGIYSSSVNKSTLDESPMAYKPMEEIIGNIGDTVEIVKTLKPIYNFKASE